MRFARALAGFVLAVGLVPAVDGEAAAPPATRAGAALPSVSFVATCGFSHRSMDDPIVHPGMAGMSHRHDFFGNRSTSSSSTVASLRASSTTCDRSTDMSAYWVPSLVGGAWASPLRAYYSAGAVDPSVIVTMPVGLQLIGGDAHASERSVPSAEAIAFSCGRSVNESGWTAVPPKCPGPLSVRVTFPQCWDGHTLAAPGNATGPVGGRCPQAFPVALPRLQIVARISGPVVASGFRTSAGGPAQMHADFVNVWDAEALNRIVSICTRGKRSSNRDIKECHARGTGPRAVGGPDVKETNF